MRQDPQDSKPTALRAERDWLRDGNAHPDLSPRRGKAAQERPSADPATFSGLMGLIPSDQDGFVWQKDIHVRPEASSGPVGDLQRTNAPVRSKT